MTRWFVCSVLAVLGVFHAQEQEKKNEPIVLKPARVFDGAAMHENWIVVVQGSKIEAAGPADSVTVPARAQIIELKNETLLPGLIDAHTHLLLHPYDEAKWDDQVLKESAALRVCRATNH